MDSKVWEASDSAVPNGRQPASPVCAFFGTQPQVGRGLPRAGESDSPPRFVQLQQVDAEANGGRCFRPLQFWTRSGQSG